MPQKTLNYVLPLDRTTILLGEQRRKMARSAQAYPRGRVFIQIRDLDQTVIGNPAHDLIRLGLSLASAARGSDLPGVTTAHMLEQMMEGYEDAFRDEGAKTDVP